MSNSLFGSSGIRGHAETFFTNQFSFDVGRTFALFLKENSYLGKVGIGSDPRESSPRIKVFVSSGIIHEGLTVCDQGITPIPSMNYLIKAKPEYGGSLMVSGSHIKSELNGLKFFANGEEILKLHEAKIDEIYSKVAGQVTLSDLTSKIVYLPEASQLYKDYLIQKASKPYLQWKVVVDPGSGAQSEVISSVLESCGVNVVSINDKAGENFLARDTEVDKDFVDLTKIVTDNAADLGVGYDSDGDRVVFVDELGNFIPGDYTGCLVAKSQPGDSVVTPVNSSSVIETIGKKVIRTKVGSPYVVFAMKENNASFGYEANGGGIFNEMHSRDGGRMTVEILNLLKKENKKMSELIAELPKTYISRDKVEYKWELKDKIISSAKDKFKGIKIDEMDGLKIWLEPKTWILFRSSSNAPEFRVFVESDSKENSEKLLKEGLDLVNDIIKNSN